MTRHDLIARLHVAAQQRHTQSLYRHLRNVETIQGNRISIDGKPLLSFASNDYLGLAQHPALKQALVNASQHWGVGATAAHLLGGHCDEHAALEEALARWTQRSRALLFSSGYIANLAVISTLLKSDELCIQDKLNHASLLDAAKLAGCTLKRYQHRNVQSAQHQFALHPEQPALLATDAVFSMDGDIAPLRELALLCRTQKATLYVDDAHGLGILGPQGSGSVLSAGLTTKDVPCLMATLGKALGVFGAFVAGDTSFIDALIQFARPFIYTTALPPPLVAAARCAVDIAQCESWRRDKINRLVNHFRNSCFYYNIPLIYSNTPIQAVLIGDSEAANKLSCYLKGCGFFVPAIRQPTVPKNKARLRITLSALHCEQDVERLVQSIHASPFFKKISPPD